MLVARGWLLVLGLLHPTISHAAAQDQETGRRVTGGGSISVWADRDSAYRRGDGARIYFRTEVPSYVTVLRVDTDGRIRTVFPREPWGETYVRGGRTLEVAASRDRRPFTVEEDPGVGYLFAIASPSPFEYAEITRGDYWDFRVIDDGRVSGDPYVALTDLAARITPRGRYRYDIAPYYVERRYEYPRFVCYDCHSYASYQEWNPYSTSCVRYRVVIYDDPAYYPYRHNKGRNVVVVRPVRPAPRYVFKDASPGSEYVTHLRQRQSNSSGRARGDGGRTSADVGGPGAIPAPGIAPDDRQPPRGRAEQGPILRRDIRDRAVEDRRGGRSRPPAAATPGSLRPADKEPAKIPPVQRGARNPQSTGEPELRRRKPDPR
ncbi:MAG: DUF4384 domain-containing protein [Methyloceanibacter sp.]|uniref:DUF4384 domain-containing protein n=1 Tax=Methyloceanibacter sp. TaxID=1965321 RepID=UPI003D9BD865